MRLFMRVCYKQVGIVAEWLRHGWGSKPTRSSVVPFKKKRHFPRLGGLSPIKTKKLRNKF